MSNEKKLEKVKELVRIDYALQRLEDFNTFPNWSIDHKTKCLVYKLSNYEFKVMASDIASTYPREDEIIAMLIDDAKQKEIPLISEARHFPFYDELNEKEKELAEYLATTNPWNAYTILKEEGFEGLLDLIQTNVNNYKNVYNFEYAKGSMDAHSLASKELYNELDISPELTCPLIIDFKLN